MNMNVMKKMMMAGAVCVALCGSSFAGVNQKMVAHNDKHQVLQHQVQQKHVVKQKQVVVVQKHDKCRHNRHDCHKCHRVQHCYMRDDHHAAGAALLGAVVGGLLGALAS